jgi:sulfite reductase alpha subunit-like flavoprotein
MFKGVTETLAVVLSKHADMTKEQAQQLVMQWIKEKRFVVDVWG